MPSTDERYTLVMKTIHTMRFSRNTGNMEKFSTLLEGLLGLSTAIAFGHNNGEASEEEHNLIIEKAWKKLYTNLYGK